MEKTKKMIIDEIEKTNMVVDFDRDYLMRRDCKYLEWLLNHCQRCVAMKEKYENE